MKQIGQRYRVRQDPYFHGFWCIVDRIALNSLYIISRASWATYRVGDSQYYHFRNPKDALEMVRLLEISDKVNGEG
jgi:hypothetical protein